jgi:hypothetical protein
LQVWDGKQITGDIINKSTAEQLEKLIQQHIHSMTASNLPAAIMRLQKLKVQQPQLYAVCVQRYQQFAAADSTRHLSNVVYALCKAPEVIRRQHQATLQQQLVPAFLAKCAEANAQDISNVLYGMADSGQRLLEEAVQQLLNALVGQLHQAKPQNVSNTLWAVAKLGQQVPSGQLQQLLHAVVGQLHQAKPQDVSNTLWAVATMGQQVPAGQLQQLLNALVGQLHQAKPQDMVNTLWAVAKLGQQVPSGQLQQLLHAVVGQLHQAKPQEFSNALWAVATMGQQVPARQLQQLLDAFVAKLQQAMPQEASNTLTACAKLGFLPQRLLAAPGLAGLLAAGKPQELANAAWACGQLGHRDEQLMAALLAEVQQRLTAAKTSSSRSFNSQELCILGWAVAVLDLQQHAQQVLQMAKACSSMWSSIKEEGQWQLWQVHTWLLDFDLAGGQGLQVSLTQQQLQQCAEAWDQALRQTAKTRHTVFQRSVFAAVHRLPIAWQQQPQMEQLSMGTDGVTPNGALLIDIAGRTADGVLVAIEADGPTHFRQPDGGLMGTTQYWNKALAVRGYRLVSVPASKWDRISNDEQAQDQYLMQLFMKAGLVGGPPTAKTGRQPPAAAAGAAAAAAAAGSTAKAVAQAVLRKGRLPRLESPQVRKQKYCLLV